MTSFSNKIWHFMFYVDNGKHAWEESQEPKIFWMIVNSIWRIK